VDDATSRDALDEFWRGQLPIRICGGWDEALAEVDAAVAEIFGR
jgi:hypothetical protein